MRLLLDTNALLWWLDDSPRLGAEARSLIADPENHVLVSVASLWEVVVKVRVGKLTAEIADIEAALEVSGLRRLDIAPSHLRALVRLPVHHRDPFDHLLIAQAVSEEAVFVTGDRQAGAYPVPVIWAA